MRFFKIFLLCIATFACFGGVSAQRHIEVGAEVWIEPGQTDEEIDMWFRRMAENKMHSARIFLMWNYIEVAPGKYDFTIADRAFEAAKRYNMEIEASLFCTHAPVFYGKKYHYRSQFHTL